jgi:hypothetical protein
VVPAARRNVNAPPDAKPGGFWPMLWVCEIKYVRTVKVSGRWDLQKMEYLMDQGRVQYGCWINMHQRVGEGVRWTREHDKRLWRCEATAKARMPA